MSTKLNRWALAALLVFTVVAVACSGGQDEEAALDAERQAALEEIQQHKQDLDDLRAQIAAAEEAEMAAAEEEEDEAGGGDEEEETAEAEPAAEGPSLEQLRSDFEDKFGELHGAIGRYFQEVDPLIEGETPNERQMAVLRINSDEAMINARDYITEGGDYRGALNALNAALATDPENAELQAALADTEAMRYMSEERFSVIENGMTQAEVRAEIGIPHHANRRTFDNGVVAWYYPVDPEGSAAAVYFEEKRGELVVYRSNFEEVVKGDEEADA